MAQRPDAAAVRPAAHEVTAGFSPEARTRAVGMARNRARDIQAEVAPRRSPAAEHLSALAENLQTLADREADRETVGDVAADRWRQQFSAAHDLLSASGRVPGMLPAGLNPGESSRTDVELARRRGDLPTPEDLAAYDIYATERPASEAAAKILGMDLPNVRERVATEAPEDLAREMSGALAADLPLFLAGGVAGRGAAALATTDASLARGAPAVAQALARYARGGTLIGDSGALPWWQQSLLRGAQEGAVTGAGIDYNVARQEGAGRGEAAAVAGVGVVGNVALGAPLELAADAAGRLVGNWAKRVWTRAPRESKWNDLRDFVLGADDDIRQAMTEENGTPPTEPEVQQAKRDLSSAIDEAYRTSSVEAASREASNIVERRKVNGQDVYVVGIEGHSFGADAGTQVKNAVRAVDFDATPGNPEEALGGFRAANGYDRVTADGQKRPASKVESSRFQQAVQGVVQRAARLGKNVTPEQAAALLAAIKPAKPIIFGAAAAGGAEVAAENVDDPKLKTALRTAGVAALGAGVGHLTGRKAAWREALVDPLTKLRGQRAFLQSKHKPGGHWVVLDLDGFKPVNDNLGHSAGDEVLSRFGKALREATEAEGGNGDFAFRSGGDEAAVRVDTPEQAERLRARMSAWREEMGGHTVTVTASAGRTYDEADHALTPAKEAKRRRRGDVRGAARGAAGAALLYSASQSEDENVRALATGGLVFTHPKLGDLNLHPGKLIDGVSFANGKDAGDFLREFTAAGHRGEVRRQPDGTFGILVKGEPTGTAVVKAESKALVPVTDPTLPMERNRPLPGSPGRKLQPDPQGRWVSRVGQALESEKASLKLTPQEWRERLRKSPSTNAVEVDALFDAFERRLTTLEQHTDKSLAEYLKSRMSAEEMLGHLADQQFKVETNRYDSTPRPVSKAARRATQFSLPSAMEDAAHAAEFDPVGFLTVHQLYEDPFQHPSHLEAVETARVNMERAEERLREMSTDVDNDIDSNLWGGRAVGDIIYDGVQSEDRTSSILESVLEALDFRGDKDAAWQNSPKDVHNNGDGTWSITGSNGGREGSFQTRSEAEWAVRLDYLDSEGVSFDRPEFTVREMALDEADDAARLAKHAEYVKAFDPEKVDWQQVGDTKWQIRNNANTNNIVLQKEGRPKGYWFPYNSEASQRDAIHRALAEVVGVDNYRFEVVEGEGEDAIQVGVGETREDAFNDAMDGWWENEEIEMKWREAAEEDLPDFSDAISRVREAHQEYQEAESEHYHLTENAEPNDVRDNYDIESPDPELYGLREGERDASGIPWLRDDTPLEEVLANLPGVRPHTNFTLEEDEMLLAAARQALDVPEGTVIYTGDGRYVTPEKPVEEIAKDLEAPEGQEVVRFSAKEGAAGTPKWQSYGGAALQNYRELITVMKHNPLDEREFSGGHGYPSGTQHMARMGEFFTTPEGAAVAGPNDKPGRETTRVLHLAETQSDHINRANAPQFGERGSELLPIPPKGFRRVTTEFQHPATDRTMVSRSSTERFRKASHNASEAMKGLEKQAARDLLKFARANRPEWRFKEHEAAAADARNADFSKPPYEVQDYGEGAGGERFVVWRHTGNDNRTELASGASEEEAVARAARRVKKNPAPYSAKAFDDITSYAMFLPEGMSREEQAEALTKLRSDWLASPMGKNLARSYEGAVLRRSAADDAVENAFLADTPRFKVENASGEPDTPFRDQGDVARLAIQRLLTEAAENDIGTVSWANADAVTARWSEDHRTFYTSLYDEMLPSAFQSAMRWLGYGSGDFEAPKRLEYGKSDGRDVDALDNRWQARLPKDFRDRVFSRGFPLLSLGGWMLLDAIDPEAAEAQNGTGAEEGMGLGTKVALGLGAAGAVLLGGKALKRISARGGKAIRGGTTALSKVAREAAGHPSLRRPLPRLTDNEVDRLGLPPDLADAVRARIQTEVAKGTPPVETFDQARAKAAQLMAVQGEALADMDPKRVTGPEVLAIASLSREHITKGAALAQQLADPSLPLEVRERLGEEMLEHDARALTLMTAAMRGSSEQGRALNANKILANLTSDPMVWAMRAQKAMGDRPLRPDQMAEIRRLAGQPDKTAMVQYLAKLRQSTVPEQLVTLLNAGLFTRPAARVLDLVGGVGHVMVEQGALSYPRAVLDWLIGRAITGQRTASGISVEDVGQMFRGAGEGVREAAGLMGLKAMKEGGFKAWVDAIRSANVTPEMLARYDIPRMTTIDLLSRTRNPETPANQVVDFAQKAIYRSLGVADRVIHGAAYRGALNEAARAQALTEGHPNVRQRAKELVANPPDELVAKAMHVADQMTFQNNDATAQATRAVLSAPAQAVRKVAGPTAGDMVGAAVRFQFPVQRTVANIGAKVADYTAIGAASGIWNIARAAVKTRIGDTKGAGEAQRRAVEALSRFAGGTALLALGAWLAEEDLMTGAAPTDSGERQRWRVEGRVPNAMLIDGEWVPIGRLPPGGTVLALGATLHGMQKRGKAVGLGGQAMGAARTILDQPLVTGTKSALDAIRDPVGQGERYGEMQAGRVVPTALAMALQNAAGGAWRDPDGPVEAVQARLDPEGSLGLWDRVPAQRNALGETVRGAPGQSGLYNPFRGPEDRRESDPLIAETSRAGWEPSGTRRNPDETNVDYEGRLVHQGAEVRRALTNAVNSPTYQQAEQTAARLLRNPAGLARLAAEYDVPTPTTVAETAALVRRDLLQQAERTARGAARTSLADSLRALAESP